MYTNHLELTYADELHNYDIYPKVVPVGVRAELTVRPLGRHAALRAAGYELIVRPLGEGSPWDYPDRPNCAKIEAKPEPDGCIRFAFEFPSEQEYYIRLSDGDQFRLQLSVYAVNDDLCGRYPFRGDLHMHSFRSDGKQAPEIVAAYYRQTGYDFLAITDHERYYPSLEAMAAFEGLPTDYTLVPGEEVHLPKGPGHANDIHIINFGGTYSINGLVRATAQCREAGEEAAKRAIIPNPPPVRSKEEHWAEIDKYAGELKVPAGVEPYTYADCRWIFNEIKKAGGLGIFCHPYWISDVYHVPVSLTDYLMETHPFGAFEVLGGEDYFEQNGFQAITYYEDQAKGRRYPIVGSTDSHSAFNNRCARICSTIVFAPACERRALIESIEGFYSVAVDTIDASPRYVGELRLVRYARFLEKHWFPLHDELCFEEGRALRDYVLGAEGARKTLEAMAGRTARLRAKYFAR
ncbi:MAG: hypothetical protein LBG83_04175 [Oscillospiraceae bacterium]|jgi:hypothetical protein|nr:hypothetical protein [Oscillospiraceae bacterium]